MREFDPLNAAIALHESGRLHDAEIAYGRVIEETPGDADALHMLGILLIQQGRWPEARARLRSALELDPEVPEFHYTSGTIEQSLGDVDAATSAYERALELDSELPDAWLNLGQCREHSGNLDAAIAAYRRAAALSPSARPALNHLANALIASGETAEARDILTGLVSDEPAAESLHALGRAAYGESDLDAADRNSQKPERL